MGAFQKIASGAKLDKAEIATIKRQVDLFKKLQDAHPVAVVKVSPEAEAWGGGFYERDKNEIVTSKKDPEALAHELGHAMLDQAVLGKALQHPLPQGLFPWTPVAGALGGVLMAKGKKVGLLLPVATAAPKLLAEFLATRKGAKALKDAGASEEEIKQYRRSSKDAFKTYTGVVPQAGLSGGASFLLATL